MDFLSQCLGRQPKPPSTSSTNPTTSDAAADFISTLYNAEKDGEELKQALRSILSANSWRSQFAQAVFAALQQALETAKPMNQGLRNVYDKVVIVLNDIEGFVTEHPVLCAVVALGILVVVAPWVVEALGFVEGGILEDSFAAVWQSKYAGFVPKGSLFSMLQRLGMKGFV